MIYLKKNYEDQLGNLKTEKNDLETANLMQEEEIQNLKQALEDKNKEGENLAQRMKDADKLNNNMMEAIKK